MKKSLKYIFGILLTSALLVTGCGSSSSNNPVGNGSVNSGLVSVSGSVKNSNGDGTVSFYSPSAIYSNNMNSDSSFRAAVNNEVYTFNIDENGNYAGQVPAGDYYIIAQNSDGSLKYASGRMAVQSEAVAEGDTDKVDFDITLVPTISISGTLHTASELVKDQYVYIENMPFVAITDSTGNFTLTSVPATDTYTICSNIWFGETRYHFSFPIDSEYISKYKDETTKTITDVDLRNFDPIALNGDKLSKVSIKFEPLPGNIKIINIYGLTDNKVFLAIPDYSYMTNDKPDTYILPLSSNSEVSKLVIQTVDESNNAENKILEVENDTTLEGSNNIIVNVFGV